MRSLLATLFAFSCAGARLPASALVSTPPKRLALAAPEPRRVLVVNGVELAVHDSAPGSTAPALVCLHAIGHGGGDFEAFAAALPAHRIITVDWPGHGASGSDEQPPTARRYAQLLGGLLDVLGLERPVLVGNSIGGAAAVRFAAEHPGRVRALVLANPGGFDPGGWLAGLFIGHLERSFHDGVEGRVSFARWYERYYEDILVGAPAVQRRAAIVAAGYESASLLEQAWHGFAQPEADQRALAPRLTMPVWVAWADDDGLIQWSRNRAAVESIPNVRVAHFPGGHAPFLEVPEPFFAQLTAFLASLPR